MIRSRNRVNVLLSHPNLFSLGDKAQLLFQTSGNVDEVLLRMQIEIEKNISIVVNVNLTAGTTDLSAIMNRCVTREEIILLTILRISQDVRRPIILQIEGDTRLKILAKARV